ncbi:MAG TPA: T9SS type A sorting domain-containing protein [Bacteroidia bacterium]
MKTTLIYAIGVLLSFPYCLAQTLHFPQINTNIWFSLHIEGGIPTVEKGYIHGWHNGDTLINGDTWLRFTYQKQVKNMYALTPTIDTTILSPVLNLDNIYYLFSNDTVYYFNQLNNKKSFYWYNNPQQGDIWVYEVYNPEFNRIDTAYTLVESVSPFDINGINSKNIKIKSCDSLGNISFSNHPNYFTINVNATNINTVLGPFVWKLNFNYHSNTSIYEYPLIHDESLICYQSADVPTYQTNHSFPDCLAYITLSVEDADLKSEQVSYFPNPVQNQLNLYNQSSSVIYTGFITDLSGRKQGINFSLNTESTTVVSLSTLQSGMYILVLTDQDGNSQTHKFIKQ